MSNSNLNSGDRLNQIEALLQQSAHGATRAGDGARPTGEEPAFSCAWTTKLLNLTDWVSEEIVINTVDTFQVSPNRKIFKS